MALKRVMVLTGGGDCPGLNAVIRGIVKRASQTSDWEVVGCIESFNGVLREPTEIQMLDEKSVEGLQIQGGTILAVTKCCVSCSIWAWMPSSTLEATVRSASRWVSPRKDSTSWAFPRPSTTTSRSPITPSVSKLLCKFAPMPSTNSSPLRLHTTVSSFLK